MRDIDEFYAALGAAVRKRREELGLTQAELSERVGLSRTSITNIERGRQRLLADQLQSVAFSLDLRTDQLLPQRNRKRARVRSGAMHLRSMPTVARFVENELADLRSEEA